MDWITQIEKRKFLIVGSILVVTFSALVVTSFSVLLRTLPYRMGLSKAKTDAKSKSRDHAERGGAMVKILSLIQRREVENLKNKRAMRFGGSCLIVAKCT